MTKIENPKFLLGERLYSENIIELANYLPHFVPDINKVVINKRQKGDFEILCQLKEGTGVEIFHASAHVINSGVEEWSDYVGEGIDVTRVYMHIADFEYNRKKLDIFRNQLLRDAFTALHGWWMQNNDDKSYIVNVGGHAIYVEKEFEETGPLFGDIVGTIEKFINSRNKILNKLQEALG